MSITILKEDVKRKCMISVSDTSYDTSIQSLIDEMKPALESRIALDYLEDTSNTALQAALKLGMLEIICGEFLEQLNREAGAVESFGIGGLTIGESKRQGAVLISQGEQKLLPYLKTQAEDANDFTSSSTSLERNTAFCLDEPVW